ncbi:uncharacterized protein LOC132279302 [Cornus florida]|uniref:uncharacterized protein LOC132279302 n=1 Tax=Cornus florida TaxID=4283 RepID=UPI0028A19465|nr:uncharacterized protein LOC132279302 [Cornus florida]
MFINDEFLKKSGTNTKNREKNVTNHCSGSKPFFRSRYEMRNEETQEEPDLVTFYKKTHCREKGEKKGTWMTPQCEELHAKMVQNLQSHASDDSSESGLVQMTPTEAFS